ncbi:MAG: M23 family metallopeptidase [candidate division Zixibacteria bacterium]|nr:M23 family metallopeptidase [candidate division Zixibacteria bacterium]
MFRLSTKPAALLATAVLLLTAGSVAGQEWPIKEQIDLSSGFGDFRQDHFHGGIDIRTGGEEGLEIFSPVDGHVWRVKMSYDGYGKGLYIRGKDGHIYVFGHLSRFADEIEQPVRARQVAQRTYAQDIYFSEDSLQVRKGQLIGYTGQSGYGGPHLHFEERTADNRPLNPLKHGLKLRDKVKPQFTRIGFQMTDDSSLFDNGTRKVFIDLPLGRKPGAYHLDTTLYFHRPVGVLAECFDMMRPEGMKQSVYKLSLYFDGRLYYEAILDTLDYETSDAVNLEFDYLSAMDDRKHVRRLFEKAGNRFTGSHAVSGARGVFGLVAEKPGKYEGKIVAEDCDGNKSELTFDFLWGPPGDMVALDSMVVHSYRDADCYFSTLPEISDFDIDSLTVFVNRGDMWYRVGSISVGDSDQPSLKCALSVGDVENALLRVFLFNRDGCLIRDNIFNGVAERGKKRVELAYEIIEDGLLVTLDAHVKRASQTRLELYYRDSLLGIEYPRLFNMLQYICFIPPKKEYARIDRIGFAMSADASMSPRMKDSLNIMVVGLEDTEEMTFGDRFKLTTGKLDFHEPRFIEVRENYILNKGPLLLNSEHYVITPESFACRDYFEVAVSMKRAGAYDRYSGLCWLDEKKNRWVWLRDNQYLGDWLTARAGGGGSVAAVFDYDPPEINRLNIIAGRTYPRDRVDIRFETRDTLSGIPSDGGITVTLNGQWLPCDYDPETLQARAVPPSPPEPGEHHLGITITDRVGNRTERFAKFRVQ